MSVIALVSHLTFLFCCTSVPRPPVLATDFALIAWWSRLTYRWNACPSLHASLSVILCCGVTDWRLYAALLLYWSGSWTWTLAILYATLALRQHVLVDHLLAGAVLATVVFALSGLWTPWKSINRGLSSFLTCLPK